MSTGDLQRIDAGEDLAETMAMRPRVLLVDDDEMLRFMAVTALEQAGFIVIECADASDIVAVCEQRRPDIALLDVMMPGVDGFSACQALRSVPAGKHLPILMMTGLEDIDSVVKAYDAGATDFINKPLNYTLLSYRLRYMLRSKRTGDELRASRSLLEEAQRVAGLAYWESGESGRFLRRSEAMAETLGLDAADQPDSYEDLLARVVDEDRDGLRGAVERALANREDYELEHRLLASNGELRTVYQQGRWVERADGRARLLGIIQDISERRRAEQQLQQLAFYDPVTRLPNRALMLRRLNEALLLARRAGKLVGVLVLDIDDFQRVNNSLGHETGNQLIRQAGVRVRDCIRETDALAQQVKSAGPMDSPSTVARMAGDEFTVILNQIDDAEAAGRVANRLREVFEEPFRLEQQEVVVSLSIGVSVYPDDGIEAETLLKNADIALSHAKKAGRDCARFYQASMNASVTTRLSMETRLRRAIEEQALELYLQPKVRAGDGRCIGMEALIRWEHPELGRVPPPAFIPVAEETGLIIPLGEWILEQACTMTSRLRGEGYDDLICAVNLSAVQFRSDGLIGQVHAALRQAALPAAHLELELTENLLMEDTESAMSMLASLRQLGVSLAIDDFGTGFSSLSYLKRLPVGTLKIDRSFIKDLAPGGEDSAIVSAVIAMAHSLGLKVVAEGVDDARQVDILRAEACDEIQGYLFARPMPLPEFRDWLAENRAATEVSVGVA